MIVNFTPWSALAGGALIGLAASLLMATLGRIAGISGMVSGLLPGSVAGDRGWRLAFLIGITAGALGYSWLSGQRLPATDAAWPLVLMAGALVGIGTRIGNGCTSGHGVCGLARLSLRSLAAVLTFLLTAIVTTFVVRHLLGISA